MKILVTGTAGFIGFHLAKRLLEQGMEVVGLDNINDYYDPQLKAARLKATGVVAEAGNYNRFIQSSLYENYRFINLDLKDAEQINQLFDTEKFDVVCNLAAQAGVRYSIENPRSYIRSNVDGFLNLLEGCRNNPVRHFVYASSSSVYGLNGSMPLSTHIATDHPISLYAATKKTNELMAHCYSFLFNIPLTGIRFFTVYGPWGRPDMAMFKFTKAILEDQPLDVYNNGNMMRDFTYVDDIVEGVLRVIDTPPSKNLKWSNIVNDSSTSVAPYHIYNLGNSSPTKLMDYVRAIEKATGKTAHINFLPRQPGDMLDTYADMLPMQYDLDYQPKTELQFGVDKFVEWYRSYYQC
ncbi:NAD-dependent epimerase [Mucilaginibacter corticis]|uniref:NAD-dependent epimerase n=1 Tax=Mucilaginibacter corticis TaxID=2597670 RepID=A0A556MMG4_9SPHI|nr:NAD-dependent epimerase [Mucilaginibacter corticis]TSJ40992.1 NAD-dependent epimerase [Mucilaginibacter corticis]